MKKGKSQFVSAFGTSFQIFKALSDSVLDIGGNDDDVRRILVDSQLRSDLAARIITSRNRPDPKTAVFDRAIEQIEKAEEERLRPQREDDQKIRAFAEEYWAWAQSDEGRKAAKLLELNRNWIGSALEDTCSTHLHGHPNLDSSMKNWTISLDKADCNESTGWWYKYRMGTQSSSCLEFVRHQVLLVAELRQLPFRDPYGWLSIRLKNAFPRAKFEKKNDGKGKQTLTGILGSKGFVVNYTERGQNTPYNFSTFALIDGKRGSDLYGRYKEEVFHSVSDYLKE